MHPTHSMKIFAPSLHFATSTEGDLNTFARADVGEGSVRAIKGDAKILGDGFGSTAATIDTSSTNNAHLGVEQTAGDAGRFCLGDETVGILSGSGMAFLLGHDYCDGVMVEMMPLLLS